jgi:Ni,Fe-hydrogenase I large subunit
MTNQQKENVLRGIVVSSYLESLDKTELLAYIDLLKSKKADKQTILSNSYQFEIKDLKQTIQNMSELINKMAGFIHEEKIFSHICTSKNCDNIHRFYKNDMDNNNECAKCIINHFRG